MSLWSDLPTLKIDGAGEGGQTVATSDDEVARGRAELGDHLGRRAPHDQVRLAASEDAQERRVLAGPGAVGPAPDGAIDPSRPAVIARCLDQIALAVERISHIVWEINQSNRSR